MRCGKKTRNGGKCGSHALIGGTVCRMHGGGAPQVKEANARNILKALVSPALAQLKLIVDNPKTPPAVKLAAVRDILDRTGFGATRHVEVVTLDLIDAEIRKLESELGRDPRPLPSET